MNCVVIPAYRAAGTILPVISGIGPEIDRKRLPFVPGVVQVSAIIPVLIHVAGWDLASHSAPPSRLFSSLNTAAYSRLM